MTSMTHSTMTCGLRKGNRDAAEAVVKKYEPALRRCARYRLWRNPLNQVYDSSDIVQSVFTNFMIGAEKGQFDLDTPEKTLNLLYAMTLNKVSHRGRDESAGCRDIRLKVDIADHDMADPATTRMPEREAEARELLAKLREEMKPDELQLVEMRVAGDAWNKIAEQVGSNAAALRQKLHRALARINNKFGILSE